MILCVNGWVYVCEWVGMCVSGWVGMGMSGLVCV